MCGIFGRFARTGELGDLSALCNATNLLAHRGPDDGTWWSDAGFFLGHRRLSIIDLVAGGQPMASSDGRHVVVFNGEIYNYLELRQRLIAEGVEFQTSSDTEVILQGYRRWGTSVAKELVGMFAFALVDRLEESLYLARDRFGEKPLFVTEVDGNVTFASEVRALAALSGARRTIDQVALADFLSLNYVPGQRTLLDGVERLRPGSWRKYTRSDVCEDTYWSPAREDGIARFSDSRTALPTLRSLIDQAIAIALRSDVPVTLFLSGGIDSSIIAESAVRQGKLKHAYCLDFAEPGFSELSNAQAVAGKLGIELRRAVLSPAALDDFLSIVEHADDPLADSSCLAVWALSREVARDYKVAISGDGGDELFGGYLTYRATQLHRTLTSSLPAGARAALGWIGSQLPATGGKVTTSYKLRRFLRAAHLPTNEAHFTWNGAWLPADAATMVNDPEVAALARSAGHRLAQRHRLPQSPSLFDLQVADVSDYLPNDILAKVDRMTMAHGLESRAPFLVPDVAEFAFSLPDHLKLAPGGTTKKILRDLASELFGSTIGSARKQGFSIPVNSWLRSAARPLMEDLLSREALEAVGLLDTDAILRAKSLHLAHRAQLGFELWGLMVLVAWHRARITGTTHTYRSSGLRRVTIPMRQACEA
jgi:asparagine synthase (glutamine-hydrolysing)